MRINQAVRMRSRLSQRGYTLVELLVGVALGSVVLGFLGGTLLLSQLRVSANIQRNLDTKDAASSAIDLMRREASVSRFMRKPSGSLSGSGSPLANCLGAQIAYFQRTDPSSDPSICYKTIAPADLPSVYQSAGITGPCVLVRLGRPYMPNGDLDSQADKVPSVMLDGIVRSGTSCASTTGISVTVGSGAVNRNADVEITQVLNQGIVGALNPQIRYKYGLRVPSSPQYDGNEVYSTSSCATSTGSTGCGATDETTRHFKPLMSSASESFTGNDSKENVFYFSYPYSEYSLQGDSSGSSCTYKQCYVQRNGAAVQLTNVDVLIFADREIRPNT
jgi:prepilin-type N-terminal cleavage/methylation domain-containing protein